MNDTSAFFYDYADAEFEGESYNGPSLMKTLDGLSPEAAAWDRTWEGHSAWGVALHLAWYKRLVARAFLGDEAVDPWPFKLGENGFGLVEEASEAAWAEVRAYLIRMHRLAAGAIRAAGPEKLASTMDAWKISHGQLVAWYLGHDSYHIGQIRSMGVPGLKDPTS